MYLICESQCFKEYKSERLFVILPSRVNNQGAVEMLEEVLVFCFFVFETDKQGVMETLQDVLVE